jgi:hypothetical protein
MYDQEMVEYQRALNFDLVLNMVPVVAVGIGLIVAAFAGPFILADMIRVLAQ